MANTYQRVHLLRRIAISLIALFLFAQASVVLAACAMDRASMAQAMAMPGDQTCGDCSQPDQETVTAACVAHCTADLQLSGAERDVAVPLSAVPTTAVLAVPRFRGPLVIAYLPPGNLPRRILLHSFQV